MVEIKHGCFTLDLGIFKVQASVSEEDRQCAWELYTEISTRRSLVGKAGDEKCVDYEGEVLVESLDSVHVFFRECRGIMRKFPVGKLPDQTKHLGILTNQLLINVLRPFLEKWQSDFRYWWGQKANPNLPPFERQKEYPRYDEFLGDWTNLRLLMRDLQKEMLAQYKLNDVDI